MFGRRTIAYDLREVLLFLGYKESAIAGTVKQVRRKKRNISRVKAEDISDELEKRVLESERLLIDRFYGDRDYRFYGDMALTLNRVPTLRRLYKKIDRSPSLQKRTYRRKYYPGYIEVC